MALGSRREVFPFAFHLNSKRKGPEASLHLCLVTTMAHIYIQITVKTKPEQEYLSIFDNISITPLDDLIRTEERFAETAAILTYLDPLLFDLEAI